MVSTLHGFCNQDEKWQLHIVVVSYINIKCSTEFKNQEFFRGAVDREDEPKVSVCANSFGYPLRTLEWTMHFEWFIYILF